MKAGQAAIWRIKSGFMQEVMARVGKAEVKDEVEEFTPLTLSLAGTDKTRGPMQLPQSHSKGKKRRKLAQLRKFGQVDTCDREGQGGRAEGRSRQNGGASMQIVPSKYMADRKAGANVNT